MEKSLTIPLSPTLSPTLSQEREDDMEQDQPFDIITTLYSGTATSVSRARRGKKNYVLKTSSTAMNANKVQKYYRELMIASSVNSDYVVKYIDLKRIGYGFTLVMSDIGGVALRRVLPAGGLDINVFLPIAINIVKGLQDIHAAGVIHNDINPQNIVINTATRALNIIDFGISTRMAKDEVSVEGPQQIQGTYQYMSPEQTGRMNRPVDYRTDFYSLGITFYEMLCGRTPFTEVTDPIEQLYQHIAVPPRPLYEFKSGSNNPSNNSSTVGGGGGTIMKALSDVVMKLIAKNAEDRYQDSEGLLHDLIYIQQNFVTGSNIVDFVAGQNDVHHFQISQRLYGREIESQKLVENMEQVSKGTDNIVLWLVHGYSGVGKTTLINEVHKPLTKDKGFFVSGKFNQFSGDIPYAAFVQALKQLMRQLLTESEEKLKYWKNRLCNGLGANGQVMVDVVPELEFIIGPQKPVEALAAVENQQRFNSTFFSFITATASKEHPLVIFLDDLQWADSGTLSLLTLLMTSKNNNNNEGVKNHLLLLGAYRDNEVNDEHPFIKTITNIKSKGVSLEDITLEPLCENDVKALVFNSFLSPQNITTTTNSPPPTTNSPPPTTNSPTTTPTNTQTTTAEIQLVTTTTANNITTSTVVEDVVIVSNSVQNELEPLARLIYKKTQGNPFFVNQLLTTLHRDGHVTLVKKPGGGGKQWKCDMKSVESANYTSNVVDLMVQKLRKLPSDVQYVLGTAAVIGTQFDIILLSKLHNFTRTQMTQHLHTPLLEGFISPIMSLDEDITSSTENSSYDNDSIINEMVDHIEQRLRDLKTSETELSKSDNIAMLMKNTFRFTHDRVQQAASCLLSADDVKRIHLLIAEVLLKMGNLSELDRMVVVNHLNLGYDADTLPYDNATHSEDNFLPFTIVSAARLNLLVAFKAKDTNAYETALGYINTGISLLDREADRSWSHHYDTTFALHKMKAEITCLLARYSEAELIFPHLISRARNSVDKANVYLIQNSQLEAQNKVSDGIDLLIKALQLFEIILPARDATPEVTKILLDDVINQINLAMPPKFGGKSENENPFNNLDTITEPSKLVIMKMLMAMWSPGYILGLRPFCGLISAYCVLFTIKWKAICAEAAVGCVCLGFYLGPLMNDYVIASEYGNLGLSFMINRFSQNKGIHGRASLLFATSVNHWVTPLISNCNLLEAAYDMSKQAGDTVWASYTRHYIIDYYFLGGHPLVEIVNTYNKYMNASDKLFVPFTKVCAQPIYDLMGNSGYDYLEGAPYEGSLFDTDLWHKTGYHFARMITTYIMKDRKNWLSHADNALKLVIPLMGGLYKVAETWTLSSLIYLDWISRSPLAAEIYGKRKVNSRSKNAITLIEDNSDLESELLLPREEQIVLLQQRIKSINDAITSLNKPEEDCKANFHHKKLLLQAECARVSLILNNNTLFNNGNQYTIDDAIELYESAIENARENKFNNYEAIGLELYGRFWLTAFPYPNPHAAMGYLGKSFLAYENWGAVAKARQIHTSCTLLSSHAVPPILPFIQHHNIYNYNTSSTSITTTSGASASSTSGSEVDEIIEGDDVVVVLGASGTPTTGTTQDTKSKTRTSGSTVSALDLQAVVTASQTVCNEVDTDQLIVKMMKVIVEFCNAQRGTFFMVEDDSENNNNSESKSESNSNDDAQQVLVAAEYSPNCDDSSSLTHKVTNGYITLIHTRQLLENWSHGPHNIIWFVRRVVQPIVLKCAQTDSQFGSDNYIKNNNVLSVMCFPILLKNKLKGIMYLENNIAEGVFTQSRVNLLSVLASQMAISLENIRFFHRQMEIQIEKLRFEQLERREENQRLRADAAEKYKGQLENFIDMICHEIRNPLNGIFGNSELIFHYIETLNNSLSQLHAVDPVQQQAMITSLLETIAQVSSSAKSVQVCAEHQKIITDDALQLSKLRAHKISVIHSYFSPRDLMETIVSMFRAQAENKGLYLRLNITNDEKGRRMVWGDSVRVTQIVTNLISNAIKFTRVGGIEINVAINNISDDSLMQESPATSSELSDSTSLVNPINSSTGSDPNSATPDSPNSPQSNHPSPVNPYSIDSILKTSGNTLEDSQQHKTNNSNNNDSDSDSSSNNENEVPCYFFVSVKDTGIGLTPSERQQLFKRFSQANTRTSQEYGGSGLGLSICRKLAKLMTGSLEISSEKGVGSTFYLKLLSKHTRKQESPYIAVNSPITSPTLISQHSNSPSQSKQNQRSVPPQLQLDGAVSPSDVSPVASKNILLVEDNLMNQILLVRLLKLKGHEVDVANNGLEGFEKFQEKNYDIVLMDIQMPVLNGLESTIQIRKFETNQDRKPAFIIGLSGNARDEYKQQALSAGMNEYLTKPYHKETLYKLLE